jgi:hypothetical protein
MNPSRTKMVILNVGVICVAWRLPFAFALVNHSGDIRVPQIQ